MNKFYEEVQGCNQEEINEAARVQAYWDAPSKYFNPCKPETEEWTAYEQAFTEELNGYIRGEAYAEQNERNGPARY